MHPTSFLPRPLSALGSRLALAKLLLVLAMSSGAAATQAAPPSSDKLLSGKFYQIELIVFTRLGVTEANTAEQLTALDGSRLPARVASFRSIDGQRSYPFELEPKTRRMLNNSSRLFGQQLPLPGAGTLVAAVRSEMAQATGIIQREPSAADNPLPGVDPEQALAEAIANYEAELAQTSFAFRSDGLSRLADVAARLNRSRGYRLLHTGAWHQHVPARKDALPLLIQAGQRTEDLYQLEGTVSVGLGRYLHVEADFWYYEPELGAYTEVIAADSEAVSGTMLATDPVATEEPTENQATEPALNYRTVVPPGDYRMHLSEKRRMRSAELHYLDHPKLGVLVRIDPVPLSEAVLTAYAAARGE